MKNSYNIQTKLKSSPGFTLMEVLIAITILSVGMIGSISLINSNISNTANAINKIIAANLAQEGIEMVRNVRDTNFLKIINGDASAKWDDNLVQVVDDMNQILFFCGGEDRSINYSPPIGIDACGASCNVVIYRKNLGNQFSCYSDYDTFTNSHGLGPKNKIKDTIFSRFITVEKMEGGDLASTNDDPILATVVIKWTNRGISQTLTVTEKLYDWK